MNDISMTLYGHDHYVMLSIHFGGNQDILEFSTEFILSLIVLLHAIVVRIFVHIFDFFHPILD